MAIATRSDRATVTMPSDRELVITRVFDAPRALVWEALTKPEHVRRWYGPRRLTLAVCEMDLRVGGHWRYVMCEPDGSGEYAFSGVYRAIEPPERLESTEVYEGMPGTDYLATVTLEEHAGQTTLRTHLLYQAPEHRDGHVASGMEAGMNETYDRLAELLPALAAGSTADREIVQERMLDAPRELVFKAWTDPRQIGRWWGPNGFTTTISQMDVRPGGVWRFVMHGPDGTDYQNRVVYQEIAPPERLVYLHGGGEDEGDEEQFHVTVTFADRGGRTHLTQRTVFATTAARDAKVAFGAVELGQQTLGRLAEYLASQNPK